MRPNNVEPCHIGHIFFTKRKLQQGNLCGYVALSLELSSIPRETFTDNNSLPFAGYWLRCWAKSPELDSSVRPSIKAHFQVFREEGRMGPHWNQFIRIEEATNNKKKQQQYNTYHQLCDHIFFQKDLMNQQPHPKCSKNDD